MFLGIDVGTGSARAGLFDAQGVRHGMGVSPFPMWKPQDDFAQQSSDAIWRACGEAVRAALKEAGCAPDTIRGIGFDATCSLVALDADDRPVTISPDGDDAQNVIVWMDHRALDQTARINATGHDVLRYVGGRMSPEMEPPKLLWLKENLPGTWSRTKRFFDLPDFLVYHATAVDVRSLCTTVCKWTYRGKEQRWDESFFRAVGLGDLADEGWSRIGTDVRPMGGRAGVLHERAAAELGLVAGIPVGVSIIDAHAGGLGLLGARVDDDPIDLETRLALIGGTSSCHMAVSTEPQFIDGIWGPYYSAMVPGMWLTEGGQSATGALIDHVIHTHVRGAELAAKGDAYGVLNEVLAGLGPDATRDLHVLPYFHGNRSPRADPRLTGMISGLKLTDSIESLARLYAATIEAIAHGTRHIVDAMNAHAYRIDTLVACGGDTKNPTFVKAHADITGCRVMLPREPEAVLLGAAMLGAVASGSGELRDLLSSMNAAAQIVQPDPKMRAYHGSKHRIFHRMYEDQRAYAEIMQS